MIKYILALFVSLSLAFSAPTSTGNTHVTVAIKAYNTAIERGLRPKNLVMVVDFSIPSNQKRLFIVNVHSKQVVYATYVTHGIGSGKGTIPTQFSNTPNSKMSSLGLYITQEFYIGKHGKSLRIKGLDHTNNKARERAIVVHGASYIGNGKTGTSWGCFAVPNSEILTVLKILGANSLIIATD